VTDEQKKVADAHASRDWSQRRRWTCPCAVCVEARKEKYEPQGSGWLMGDTNESR